MEPASEFDRSLGESVDAVLVRGGLVAAGLGFFLCATLGTLQSLGLVRGLGLPVVFAGATGAYSLMFHQLASRRVMGTKALYALLIPLMVSPTILLLTAEQLLPSGAATFITGPISHLYFLFIVLSAFTFEARIPYLTGTVSAAGYLGVFFLTRKHLDQLSAPDPTLLQDLQGVPVYAVKAMMMLATGLLAGALSAFSRRLVGRLVAQRSESETLSRLFGEYVSPEVRERLTRPGVLKGERRQLALLFSDIRDFTAWAEAHPPEQIVERLNVYFDRMVGAITSNGGVVDKFIGDAVMGVFGGLRELENPSAAAFNAARDMRKALAELNAQWQAGGLSPLQAGIGLHFGEVLQGPLGSARRRDFTVIGDAVNTASRTEGLCRELHHPVVLTEAVRDRLPSPLQAACRDLGEVRVKGRREALKVFGVPDPG